MAGILILFLLIAAGITTYLSSENTNPETSDNRVQRFIQEEQRFQGIHYHEKNGELQLVYLWSYEPISRRFAAIYIPPTLQIISKEYSNLRRLDRLYNDLTVKQLSGEIESVSETPISFWSISSNQQLAHIVNFIGGIQLPTPTETIRIDLRSKESLEGQWMDGEMVMDYVTDSYSEFGLQGIRYRHKTFLLGLLHWLKQSPELRNNHQTFSSVKRILRTNLSTGEIKRLLEELLDTSIEKIKIPALSSPPQDNASEASRIRAKQIQRMLPRPLKKIIQRAKPQEIIRVQVLNGAGLPGLAGEIRDLLQEYSRVDVVEIGNADHYDHQTTKVIDRSGNPEAAYRVLEILNNGEFESKPSEDLMLDVTVITGRDLRTAGQSES